MTVPVSAGALTALAVDLDRYVTVEPRLRSASWRDRSPPRAGAQVDVIAEIPFSLPIVQRVVGAPRGVATLEELVPGERLVYALVTGRAEGRLEVDLTTLGSGCRVDVNGWIVPRSRSGRLALLPLITLLRRLADDAVRRAVLRAAAAL